MLQGQAYILIARFPDPNYGVKTVNFIITPITYRELPVDSSLCHLEVSLSFTLVDPTQVSITPKRKEFSMDFKNKVKGNIRGQIPVSKHKGLRGVLDSINANIILKFRSCQCDQGSMNATKITLRL